MKKTPERHYSRNPAAERLGISSKNKAFRKLFSTLVKVTQGKQEQGVSSFEIGHHQKFIFQSNWFLHENGCSYIHEDALETLEELHFQSCPHKTFEIRGRLGKKQIYHANTPIVKDGEITLTEIAELYDVSPDTIIKSPEISDLRRGYENYWIAYLEFVKNGGIRPSTVINGIDISQIGQRRIPFEEGSHYKRAISFHIKKSAVIGVFDSIPSMKASRMRIVDKGTKEKRYTPRVFCEKFFPGLGYLGMQEYFKQAEEQYWTIIGSGIHPDAPDFAKQKLWIGDTVIPASLFVYSVINKKVKFTVSENTQDAFLEIPEIALKTGGESNQWANARKLLTYFSDAVAKLDSVSEDAMEPRRVYNIFAEYSKSRLSHAISEKNRFLKEGGEDFVETEFELPAFSLDSWQIKKSVESTISAKLSDTAYTSTTGGEAGLCLKRGSALQLINFAFFIPSDRVKKNCVALRAATPRGKCHWLDEILKQSEKIPLESRSLFCNKFLFKLAVITESVQQGRSSEEIAEKTRIQDVDAKDIETRRKNGGFTTLISRGLSSKMFDSIAAEINLDKKQLDKHSMQL